VCQELTQYILSPATSQHHRKKAVVNSLDAQRAIGKHGLTSQQRLHFTIELANMSCALLTRTFYGRMGSALDSTLLLATHTVNVTSVQSGVRAVRRLLAAPVPKLAKFPDSTIVAFSVPAAQAKGVQKRLHGTKFLTSLQAHMHSNGLRLWIDGIAVNRKPVKVSGL
jgi:hypothetical protein